MSYHRLFDGMMIDGVEVDTSQLDETGKVYVGDEELDPKDLITQEDKIQIFNEDMLRTKDDIINDIYVLLDEIESERGIDPKHSLAYFDRYINLVSRFKEKIEGTIFPNKLEDWWRYSYEVRETGISLKLEHVNSIGLNCNGFIDSETVDTSFTLLHINSVLLTVDQYAKDHGVTVTTVRQWIRRGKIRSAIKQGSEWRIPELAEIKERGYQLAHFNRDAFLTDLPQEYSFLNEYDRIIIEQNKIHKNQFGIILLKNHNGDKVSTEIQMDQQEKEKFELFLISNPNISSIDELLVSRG